MGAGAEVLGDQMRQSMSDSRTSMSSNVKGCVAALATADPHPHRDVLLGLSDLPFEAVERAQAVMTMTD